MASSVCSHYTIVADYEDKDHEELVLKFIAVFRERTELWGFYDTGERLGRTYFNQLQENLNSTSVTIVVILPNHDERNHKAQYACQTVLKKTIENKEKMLILICLKGGKSEHFDIYTKIEFQGEEDWLEKKEEWDRIRTALIEAGCQPALKKDADTSLSPDDDSNFLTDRYFAEISKKIGNDWWKLGIRLGLEFSDITEIENNNDSSAKITKMLQRWKQSIDTNSEQERVTILCQALRAEKINDLANTVQNRYKNFSQVSSLKTNPAEIEKSLTNDVFLLELASKLPDWHTYCLQLGLTEARLKSLKQDYKGDTHRQAFQTLFDWRREAGDLSNEDKMEKLTNVFKQKSRMDIIKWIKGKDHMSSAEWKQCFLNNTEDGVLQLLECNDVILDQSTLEFACNNMGRKSDAIKVVCERICALFKRRPGVTHAWPAYKKYDAKYEGNVTFVVVTKNIQLFYDEGYSEGYSCYVRSYNTIDDKCKVENAIIKQNERNALASIRDLHDVQKCIAKKSKDLMAKHKHCLRITPSPLKSSTDNHKWRIQKCVALYVSIKGYIPLDEEPFPGEIGNFEVDVREGLNVCF